MSELMGLYSVDIRDDDGTISEHLHIEILRRGEEVYLDADRRRALLAHLLDAEGLPRVEEIELLKRDLHNAEPTIDKLMGDLAESRKLHQDMCAEVESLSKLVFDSRQSRLSEILEAEARERVKRQYYDLSENVTFGLNSGESGSVRLSRCGEIEVVTKFVNVEGQILCLAAALAEKRRRESEVSDHG